MMVNPADKDQPCPVCDRVPAEPMFFEGRLVCLEHLCPCQSCLGLQLRDEPACGPCVTVIKSAPTRKAA